MKTMVLLGVLCGGAFAQNSAYDRFFSDYFFRYSPTQGTSAGLHQYDSQLEDYSRKNVEAQIRDAKRLEKAFAKLPPSDDRDLVLGRLRADVLALRDIRMWEKNPDSYSSGITFSIFTIMSRKFAPEADRMRSVIAREKAIPAALEDAKANLKNPPKIYTEVALEQLPGIIGFFRKDVPAAFPGVKDSSLLAEFRQANEAAAGALEKYQEFLKNDLLPRSHGDFRLGAANYRKKLLYEEMVDTPLAELLKVGYANLRENQRAMKDAAARIDPTRDPAAVLADLMKDHPAPDELVASVSNTLSGLREFIETRHIVGIPSQVLPTVEETPPFMRALTSASMDTPGPYEKVATEAFFNVTPPEKDWPKERIEEHMQSFGRAELTTLAVHEAYPGHYVQFLWVPRAPSEAKKILGAGTNVEGWAHYCEQMMLDEGFGNGDPKLRLAQIADALLRNARYIVGVEMHTGNMTFDQGVDFFVKEGHTTRELALVETKRGTSDPTYLMYTLGKLEILKLREDYKKKQGAAFTLEGFHNEFLKQGFPPIKIVRRNLLGAEGSAL
ncbi:MAG TPA: DUF885 domain-containing protein [Bryobacteraceae bacterium]|jgi:uncharacterized protein (DUF885 family)|nr:DUF885 domain-containing protein [Bryobacteraceae bacterium]